MDKSFGALVSFDWDHFLPKPSTIVQRLKFNTRYQQPGPGETIAIFFYEFRATSNEMVRDRLERSEIHKRDSQEGDSSFNKADPKVDKLG